MMVCAAAPARAGSESVLHAFTGGLDGAFPYEGVVRDRAGSIFGTTGQGGAHNAGTVFVIPPDGPEAVIHSFRRTGTRGGDAVPGDSLAAMKGSLFGATTRGGSDGLGTVFGIDKTGRFHVLHRFTGAPDGAYPPSGLMSVQGGAVFGVTTQGGTDGNGGTLFRVDRDGQETVLHSFGGAGDASGPNGGVTMDSAGNIYGTAGGGVGSVFRVAPDGSDTVLYTFQGGADGAYPQSPLVVDKRGNVFGTTYSGGANGVGVIFRISPHGAETIVHDFGGAPADGGFPSGGLVTDGKGNLYGSTLGGGASNAGTVYRATLSGAETILYAFSGEDGYFPVAGLVRDASGALYGVTELGGAYGQGVAFKVTP
jgi:uncharacterized repeat protein (TIGR03803 family)